jgi:hypothetical protein
MQIDWTELMYTALRASERHQGAPTHLKERQTPVRLGKALLVLQFHPPLFIHPAKLRMIMSLIKLLK